MARKASLFFLKGLFYYKIGIGCGLLRLVGKVNIVNLGLVSMFFLFNSLRLPSVSGQMAYGDIFCHFVQLPCLNFF